MNTHLSEVAESCLLAAESNSMTFPEIVGKLMQAGFESYSIDFRRATATCYLPSGESVDLPTHRHHTPIAATLNIVILQAAIKRSSRLRTTHIWGSAIRSWRAVVQAMSCRSLVAAPCILAAPPRRTSNISLSPAETQARHRRASVSTHAPKRLRFFGQNLRCAILDFCTACRARIEIICAQ